MGNDETELLDAYVAMGGESDGGGCVDAQKLIDTIKIEFGMTIDIFFQLVFSSVVFRYLVWGTVEYN